MISPLSFSPSRQRGVALILVLGTLVFVSVLIVAFFGSVSHELASSKSYASGASSRIYADAAVNLVIGQLQAGTTQDDATRTWTSQPGLICRFTDQGRQENVFKLYSSNKMVEDASFSPLSAGGAPSDVPNWTAGTDSASLPWNLYPNIYTDLNAPLVVTSGSSSVAKYPILNPAGLASAIKIDGFDVDSTRALTNTLDMTKSKSPGAVDQIPMPVRWIYILTDGRIATADTNASDATSVTLVTADGQPVAASNPPVARVAFWTDDDTCRLNVNTASEGSYWSLPSAPNGDDALSTCQVAAREYQRYPGHPATTSLSPVMNFLTAANNAATAVSGTDLRNFIFALSPRVSGRGSQFGTRYIGGSSSMPVVPSSDRLFASVDELLFLPYLATGTDQRYRSSTANMMALESKRNKMDWRYTGGSFSTAGSAYSFSKSFSIDPQSLEEARFFLTTNSRAPEVNLFGKPRLSLWPVDTRGDHQSVYDRLLAFSSTVGGANAFYFQRQNPNSRTEDYDNISRNQDLYAYLNRLLSANFPGFGGSFSGKYGTGDCQQLATSIFDWVRIANLAYRDNAGNVQPYAWTPATSTGTTTNPPAAPGSGQVLPIKIGSTQGFGRFPVLSKAALGITREALTPTTASASGTVTLRAVFMMETYVPELGYAAYVPNYTVTVSGLANALNLVTGTAVSSGTVVVSGTYPLDLQDGSIRVNTAANFEAYSGRAWGGTQGFNQLFVYTDPSSNQVKARTVGDSDADKGYPFVSKSATDVVLAATNSVLYAGLRATSGTGTIPIRVTFGDSSGNVVQTYDLAFPDFKPVNTAVLSSTSISTSTLQTRVNSVAAMGGWTVEGNSDHAALGRNVTSSADIIRGLESSHGDLRLLAIHGTADNPFTQHNRYAGNTVAQAHSLLCAAGNINSLSGTMGLDRGSLAKGSSTAFNNSSHAQSYFPQAPSSATNGILSNPNCANSPGDFSNGISSESDGPHILKADEGNTSFQGLNWGMSVQFPYQNQLCPYDANLSLAFSPNRQVASAVQLGTLPSQGDSSAPWQTLLFRPAELPPQLPGTHPGAKSPADHLLLDLFWMPVVDPYPISEALSTAGKVNMNYQIAPFTYINRATALMGALKSTKLEAIPQENKTSWINGAEYKNIGYTVNASKGAPALSFLYDVDPAQTLLFFQERFSNTDTSKPSVFKSASEICSIPLAPMSGSSTLINTGYTTPANALHTVNIAGATDAATLRSRISTFWSYNTLTGDNTLEAPYNALYPRLTTQSNTYTVYVRAQSLQVGGTGSGGKFTNMQKRVSGEYRGSYQIERYIDLNDSSIPDLASPAYAAKTIYPYYKFRILSAKQFVP